MLEPLDKPGWTPGAAAHLLCRAGFGGTPAEVRALHARGLNEAVDSLLDAPEDSDLFPAPSASTPEDLTQRRESLKGKTEEQKREIQSLIRREDQSRMSELRAWWLNRMRWSPSPAREKAVLFWHGHWATSVEKVRSPFAMWQQNETLRAHSLGDFEGLAQEVSQDPAMVRYLDLEQSKRDLPNENFARELMELFTLGEGHYGEEDIQEAARAFTGYRINPKNQQFLFVERQHDNGVKSFFGFEGRFSGEDIVGFLVADPQCARFLARKLWTFYAAENPPSKLVEALAQSYRQSQMDLRKFLGTLFRSREFYSPDVVRKQIKSPVQWLVQACRELSLPLPQDSSGILRQLGQTLFAPPNVKGWDGGRSWISSATLLLRYNIAGNLVRSSALDPDAILPPTLSPEAACQSLGERLFHFTMTDGLRNQFLAFLNEHPADKKFRRDLIHLMMSTPDYQIT